MMRWWTVLLLTGLALVTAVAGSRHGRVKRIVGGSPAQLPPRLERETSTTTIKPTASPSPEPPTTSREPSTTPREPPTTPGSPGTTSEPLVFVRRDRRSALVNGLQNPDGTFSFLGIRYAEPPINRLRFQRPKRRKLRGEVDATHYGPPCPQWYRGRLVGSEDCLFLNIYTPQVPKGDNSSPPPALPVMFWVHGGHYRSGSAAQYLPRDIVRRGVVVVTVQYRLGSLGFLSLGRKELPGNVGLFDLSAAMRWVKEYIRFFGGDPRKVYPSGQGSGASAASFLALNSISRNNIRGIFAMSGSPVSPFTLDENEVRTSKEVAELDGCKAEQNIKFVRCMQALPLEAILKGDTALQSKKEERYDYSKKLSNLVNPGPAEEGAEDSRFLVHFLPQSPLAALQSGNFPSVPLLTGVTSQETQAGVKGNFLSDITKQLLNPAFLQGGLMKDLLNANIGLYVNKTVNPSLSKLFDSGTYIKFFSTLVSSVLNQLDQVVQHTTDAFFNLPAFITSHLWSQKNKVYLYSFEHKTPSSANKVLQGIPLIATNNTEERTTNHGDDLIYLFKLQSLTGEPLENATLFNADDEKVKEHFTTMVAEFLKTGVPKISGGEIWKPFSKAEGSYMILDVVPKLAQGFKKCTMALWTGDTDVLSSLQCGLSEASKIVTDTLGSVGTQLLNTVDLAEGRLGGAVGNTTAGLVKATGALQNTTKGALGVLGLGGGGPGGSKPPLVGGLLGGGGGGKTETAGGGAQPASQNKTSAGGGLLGLGGSQGKPTSSGGGGLLGIGGSPNKPASSGGGGLLGLGGGSSSQKKPNKGGGGLFGLG